MQGLGLADKLRLQSVQEMKSGLGLLALVTDRIHHDRVQKEILLGETGLIEGRVAIRAELLVFRQFGVEECRQLG